MVDQQHEAALRLVGALVVVHNRYNDLCRLLNSLALQQCRDFELLVLDNGSSEELGDLPQLPGLELVRLPENVGFVTGMIHGLRLLLAKDRYRYIWILDSDLEVAPAALANLIRSCEVETRVGVAGCAIYNSRDRELLVEAGADVDLRCGFVSARFCNERLPAMDPILEVDFVGSGSGSLICVAALRETGLHDGRYYFLWEDTDFGLALRRHGFRAVVVTDAVVYHPPFTEKRNPSIYAYYGVRNPLLTVAKYAPSGKLASYLLNNLSRYLRVALLMAFSGCRGFAGLTCRAINDFIAGRFGPVELGEIVPHGTLPGRIELPSKRPAFVIGTGAMDSICAAVTAIRRLSSAPVILVAQSYRRSLLEGIDVDGWLCYDDRSTRALVKYLQVGLAILRQGGSIVLTETRSASPLSYFSTRVYGWNPTERSLQHAPCGLWGVWKPIAALILGWLFALLLLPAVWSAALRHRNKEAQ